MKVMYYQENKMRRITILNRLLNFEHLSYQQLSDEYYVSRSSIANDLSYVKEIFTKEGLYLKFDRSGTFFEGNEIQIQRVLKRTILNHFNELEVVAELVDHQLLRTIEQAFQQGINEKQIEIPESYFKSIVISILLIVQRSKKGKKIDLIGKNQYGKYFLEFNKYPLVYELLKKLEDQDIYQFTQEEVQYLTYIIVGSGLKFFMKSENISFAFRGKIRQLIQKVSEGIQIDLTQDNRLEEDLLVHLYQLLLRLEAQTTIVNPLIDEIKQNYPSIYGVVWFALKDFRWPSEVNLSEDEVGFVTIHFQAAVERIKRLNKLLFVCPNGIGTSSFVSAKIRRILPDIDSIETASIDRLTHMDLSEIDFIISTVDIPKQSKPVVRISPMVTARDMKRIMNHYIDLVIDHEHAKENRIVSEKTKHLLGSNIYFGQYQTKEEAIHFLIEQQNFLDNHKKEQFIQSVFDRETIQSTYLDNGFAIPHGNPLFVEETAIAILVADKPVSWGNQKVDIIVLLMIREEDVKEVEAVMKLVMQGIENKNWFISKMLEVKK
ncbi:MULTISPECIES: BglG family transcription antiterminator [unclassified Enterococcus]|uniref:BglG family transcription antiterminator n=1 Tax=unclassified Enterococcus TaxID=2608891 RepID=UPI001A9AC4AE|nr:PRD domain-containing protein [Enterococcus sp. DIV1271a]MBO1300413.1 PRD domain-containing protein [Enterococcus sp. DIV1271a]